MSGLFRRLAATAAGSTNRVRSNVRSSFGGAMMGAIEQSGPDTGPAGRAEPLPAVAERTPRSPLGGVTPPRPDETRQPAAPVATAASPSAIQEVGIESGTTPVAPFRLPAPTPLVSAGNDFVMPDEAVAVAHLPTETRKMDRASARGIADIATEPARSPLRVMNEPAPLLPRAALEGNRSGVRGSPVSVAPQAAGVQSAAADEATEVHIHIGRIDVTAVHEAPPPRRKTAPARAPRSLDDYLSRRNRQ
jgi:hypothetical protein